MRTRISLALSAVVMMSACQGSSGSAASAIASTTTRSSVSFGHSTSYATGPELQQVTVADLNGDGIPDLASANFGSDTVSVLLGDGDGTFKPKLDQPASLEHPLAITSSDLNGDGLIDLVLVNGSPSDGVAVLINHGTSGFKAKVFPGGHEAQAVVAADLDGDGKPDIVTANGIGGVSVMLGRGDGSLGKSTDVSTESTMCSGVAAVDVNADGVPDLITANSLLGHGESDRSVSVLLGNGDGRFRAPTVYDDVGTQPTMIVTADLDGDGSIDLVTPNGAPSTDDSVLLGVGDGTFSSPTHIEVGENPHSVVAVDLNGDGIADLVTGDLGTSFDITHPEDQGLTVRLGLGDGTFGRTTTIANAWPTSLVAEDLNRDGKVDLIIPDEVSNSVAIVLNRTSG